MLVVVKNTFLDVLEERTACGRGDRRTASTPPLERPARRDTERTNAQLARLNASFALAGDSQPKDWEVLCVCVDLSDLVMSAARNLVIAPLHDLFQFGADRAPPTRRSRAYVPPMRLPRAAKAPLMCPRPNCPRLPKLGPLQPSWLPFNGFSPVLATRRPDLARVLPRLARL